MSVQQILILKPTDNPQHKSGETVPLEISIIAGENTLLLPSKLSQSSINIIFSAYKQLGIIYPTWKIIFNEIKDYKFEGLIDDIPEPSEGEGKMADLSLENGANVKLLVRMEKFEIEPRELIMVH